MQKVARNTRTCQKVAEPQLVESLIRGWRGRSISDPEGLAVPAHLKIKLWHMQEACIFQCLSQTFVIDEANRRGFGGILPPPALLPHRQMSKYTSSEALFSGFFKYLVQSYFQILFRVIYWSQINERSNTRKATRTKRTVLYKARSRTWEFIFTVHDTIRDIVIWFLY